MPSGTQTRVNCGTVPFFSVTLTSQDTRRGRIHTFCQREGDPVLLVSMAGVPSRLTENRVLLSARMASAARFKMRLHSASVYCGFCCATPSTQTDDAERQANGDRTGKSHPDLQARKRGQLSPRNRRVRRISRFSMWWFRGRDYWRLSARAPGFNPPLSAGLLSPAGPTP